MPVESVVSAPTTREEQAPPRAARVPRGRAVWNAVSPYWPAALVCVVFLALAALFVRRSLAENDGHFVYPIDDAYSHLAIARNLYQHGLWGFSWLDGFSSGGSSLIWPLLLAGGFAVFGVHDWLALALNLVAASAFFFYAGAFIRRHTRSGVAGLLILLAVMYFTPLPTIAVCGMEHCWQILICLGFLDLAVRSLSDEATPEASARARLFLPVMAFFMTMIRYEGLFLLGVVGLLLLYRRYWLTAILCGVAGGFPVVAFGLYARSKGWHFLPNSLLLKASVPPLQSLDSFIAFITKGYHTLVANPHMYIVVIGLTGALIVQWRKHGSLWHPLPLLLTMLLGGTAIHLQFASLGWVYRYEGYLVGLGILAVGLAVVEEITAIFATAPTWFEKSQRLAAVALAVLLFCSPHWQRAADAWNLMAPASHNIYEQQYQMAHFVRRYFPGQGVAVNDIGAISFFNNIKLLDVWGLGTMEVTQAKLDHRYDQDVLRGLLAKYGVRLIMVYVDWAGDYGGLPAEWISVGQWTIPNDAVCASPTVWFFAPNVTMAPQLIEAMQSYRTILPPDVVQTGLYCGQPLAHVQGAYPVEKDGGGEYYWTKQAVQFALYPSDSRKDAADADASLNLSVRPMSRDMTIDLTLNGRVVASHRVEPAEAGTWVDWPVKVRWREGFNTVNLMAHGGHPKQVAGDDRQLLFAVHEPKWAYDDAPDKTYPLPAPSPSPAP